MPTETTVTSLRIDAAFAAASSAITGGLTRDEYALLALRCVDEAARSNDRRAQLDVLRALLSFGLSGETLDLIESELEATRAIRAAQ